MHLIGPVTSGVRLPGDCAWSPRQRRTLRHRGLENCPMALNSRKPGGARKMAQTAPSCLISVHEHLDELNLRPSNCSPRENRDVDQLVDKLQLRARRDCTVWNIGTCRSHQRACQHPRPKNCTCGIATGRAQPGPRAAPVESPHNGHCTVCTVRA